MQDTLERKLKASEKAFYKWKKTSFKERQKLLASLSKLLLKNKVELATLITKEMNKPISQSISEIEKCAAMCKYYAEIKNPLSIEKITTEMEISEVRPEPMGVILGVMPWNYPFWQVLRFAVPAVLAGNTVVVKHASICLKSGQRIQKLFQEAGFKKQVFSHWKVSHKEVEAMIKHPIIKGVSLTGSESAGRAIAKTAGEQLKKCVLELGGSDPFIVLDDADLKLAAKDAAQARLQNCGQTCVAAKRFIIHEKVYEKFVTLLVKEYSLFEPRDPMDRNTQLSKMAREDLANELEKQYEKAIANGAKILTPLKKKGKMGFKPGLIQVKSSNPILEEELFGPLGMILKAKNDASALAMANDSPFGLAGAVYSKSKKRTQFFSDGLEVGSVAINQVFRSDFRMPFGGRKNSGYGVELSKYALEEFSVKKSVVGHLK